MNAERRPGANWMLRSAGLAYRYALSPVLHATHRTVTGGAGACRFQPTCSQYATLAFALHGPWRGGWLALRRLLRCHPLAQGGLDPVPRRTGQEARAAGTTSHLS